MNVPLDSKQRLHVVSLLATFDSDTVINTTPEDECTNIRYLITIKDDKLGSNEVCIAANGDHMWSRSYMYVQDIDRALIDKFNYHYESLSKLHKAIN